MPRNSTPVVCCLTILISSFASFSTAQQPPQNNAQAGAGSARKASAAPAEKQGPKLSDEQKLALQLLEASEAASRGFEAPMRTYSLLQIGSTMNALEASRARGLLRDAFTASLEIRDDDQTRVRLQQDIFRALLPLSQDDVEELLPRAEMSVRRPVAEIIIGRYAEKKQFDKGMELVNQINALDEFPYGGAGSLIAAMPPEMTAEKQSLFSQAVTSYKNHEHRDVFVGNATLTGLIVRFGASMPPKLVLMAIDEILSQTKAAADAQAGQQNEVRLAGIGGVASFASAYQFQLFALLPILRELDEKRAKDLLEQNQDLQAKLEQYPQGMNSLMPPQPAPAAGTNTRTVSSTTDTTTRREGPGPGRAPGGNARGSAQDYLRQETLKKMQDVIAEGDKDPTQAIAHSLTLPAKLDNVGTLLSSPRASVLEAIASANVKKNSAGAGQALSELRKSSVDLPLSSQAKFLATAADLYLQMEEKDNAEKVVNEGFKVAGKLLEADADPDDPNQALKAWWPSAVAYHRLVAIQAKISRPATVNILREIKDPEIRALESIVFARSLLGLPFNSFIVAEKRKDATTTSSTN